MANFMEGSKPVSAFNSSVPSFAFNSAMDAVGEGHQWYGFQSGIAAEGAPVAAIDERVVENLGTRGRDLLAFIGRGPVGHELNDVTAA
jgi:hypothetical protein